jgi:hypothetical protein
MRAIGVVSLLLFLIRQSLTTLAQSKPIPVGLKIESEGGGQRFGNVGTGRNGLDAQRSQDAQNTAAGGHREAGRDQGRPARYPEHGLEHRTATKRDVWTDLGERECVPESANHPTVEEWRDASCPAERHCGDRALGTSQTWRRTGRVIRNAKGLPLSDPRHWFEPSLRAAKIRDFSWHCLRHTFAGRLVMAGVDLRTVEELLGHKNIAMTVRYPHLATAHTLAAVERLSLNNPEGSTDTRSSTVATDQVQHGFAYAQ